MPDTSLLTREAVRGTGRRVARSGESFADRFHDAAGKQPFHGFRVGKTVFLVGQGGGGLLGAGNVFYIPNSGRKPKGLAHQLHGAPDDSFFDGTTKWKLGASAKGVLLEGEGYSAREGVDLGILTGLKGVFFHPHPVRTAVYGLQTDRLVGDGKTWGGPKTRSDGKRFQVVVDLFGSGDGADLSRMANLGAALADSPVQVSVRDAATQEPLYEVLPSLSEDGRMGIPLDAPADGSSSQVRWIGGDEQDVRHPDAAAGQIAAFLRSERNNAWGYAVRPPVAV